MRDSLDIGGLWRFQPDPWQQGEAMGYSQPGLDVARWREVAVPGGFEACGPGMESYEGAGWFRRSVAVPAEWLGRRVRLQFQGVNTRCRVWVNGKLVHQGADGFLPFGPVVDQVLRYGQENVIVVCADNTRRPEDVPGLERGWRPVGGIPREVALVASDLFCISRASVQAEPVEQGGWLAVRVWASNGRAGAVKASVSVDVLDSAGVSVGRFVSPVMDAPPVAAERARMALESPDDEFSAKALLAVGPVEGVVAGARAWRPEGPALYTARITLLADGEPADQMDVRFGFRRIETQGERLLLNGQPIFLMGFNRHEDSPRTGACPDLAMARRDFIEMKRAGANFVRLCHYPHHPGELDLCDELGLLAMCEIPLCWWNGTREGEEHFSAKFEAAGRQVVKLIYRDGNHPSVIFWSVSNETEEERPEVAWGNATLVLLARSLDPSRLAVHVSHGQRWRGEPHFEADDVLCVNDYPSADRRREDAQYDPAESAAAWAESLRALHEAYPDKPILVTEFGYPALEGVVGSAVGEDVQARAIEAEFAGMTAPYMCGAAVWCFADHPWPGEDFLRYLTTSPYGVVARARRPKSALGVVRRIFTDRRGGAVTLPAEMQEHAEADPYVLMVRPTMENIPQFDFPPGFSIRPMKLGEGALWTDVQRDAEKILTIDDDVFAMEFGQDEQATQWRSFFVVNDQGSAVSVISAWYSRDYKGQDYGRIHWVATRRSYQGRGLAKAALSYTMRLMAQWHDRCFLVTSVSRLPAIKMYMDFGFVPDLDHPDAPARWKKVREALGR